LWTVNQWRLDNYNQRLEVCQPPEISIW
jgi:hypothetical protein